MAQAVGMSYLNKGVEKASSVHLKEVSQEGQGTGSWWKLATSFWVAPDHE